MGRKWPDLDVLVRILNQVEKLDWIAADLREIKVSLASDDVKHNTHHAADLTSHR